MALIIIIPTGIYIALSLPGVQNNLRLTAEKELSTLLATEITIEKVSITPYNRLTLFNVAIKDDNDSCAIKIDRLGAGVNLTKFITSGEYIVNYVELMGLNADIYRDSISSPINIQSIITALQPKDKNKPPTLFDIQVNTIVIRNADITYNILNAETKNGFDLNHLGLSDLQADIRLPRIKNDDFKIDIKRLSATERSGVQLDKLHGLFHISDRGINISDLGLILPKSRMSFDEISLSYNGWDELKRNITTLDTQIKTNGYCYVNPSDFSAFSPKLNDIDCNINIDLEFSGNAEAIKSFRLNLLSEKYNSSLSIIGNADSIIHNDSRFINISEFTLNCRENSINKILNDIPMSNNVKAYLSRLHDINININGQLDQNYAILNGNIATSSNGAIKVSFEGGQLNNKSYNINGYIATTQLLNLEQLLGNDKLGSLDFNLDFDITSDGKKHHNGYINGDIPQFTFNKYNYNNINTSITLCDTTHNAIFNINDPNISVAINTELKDTQSGYHLISEANITDLRLDSLHITDKYPGYSLSMDIFADLSGNNLKNIDGVVKLEDLIYFKKGNNYFTTTKFEIKTQNSTIPQSTTITSDNLTAEVEGKYDFASLGNSIKYITYSIIPSLFSTETRATLIENYDIDKNNFSFTINIDSIVPFIAPNIELIDPITINGKINETLALDINAPCIKHKNKLYEFSRLTLNTNTSNEGNLKITTRIPIKRGLLSFDINNRIAEDELYTTIDWDVLDKEFLEKPNNKHKPKFHGQAFIDTHIGRDEVNNIVANIDIKRSELTFNDTIWTVEPSTINVQNKLITVNGFNVHRDNQHIQLSGLASSNEEDYLELKLSDVNLDYVFESLAIPNVAFGGNATGVFHASNLFSKAPILTTDENGLQVDDLSYNYSHMGDALIDSHWDNENKAVYLQAKIKQPNNHISYVKGHIWPFEERLDFHFDADKINVGFMKPFMIAFTSDVKGYASGKANLFGSFKYIDMTGDIFAEDLKLKLDFTNTYYTATDKVHLDPGLIELNNITLKDINGNTAKLDGWITHECFKRPKFTFNITEAKNLLCYDVPDSTGAIWFGHIIGNGNASVSGVPGLVNISTEITTAPGSKFTFKLLDTEEAGDYKFITFKDRNEHLKPKLSAEAYKTDRKNKLRIAQFNPEIPTTSNYKMTITANVTEDAEVRLIMDPVGGDYIKSYGTGRLTLGYEALTEELTMKGEYNVSRGDYHFTLQDIIVKDFKLRESSIVFDGDPYAATLDINAVYTVNANLTDLDEAFATDKEVGNTNVAIDAIMEITGDMRKPNTHFSIEAPKMSSDTQTRINSIVNASEDMMSRQIIYLLALNRFYTPDYMNVKTSSNELVSVASSTLSSRLGSMLSQINENITIAPNLRSNTGDFSDLQFDLALSSSLLNNRLRLNGNLGYRDKSLNTNTFVGDFDIEYLLNRSGNFRLKAYNRYNDRNFYIKTATTTQGVGIVLKKDFDNFFSFLKPLFKNKEKNDSTQTIQNDSIPTN